jgi:hypothetical protein
VNAPIEVPADIAGRVRTLCLALPEATVRVDCSLTSTRSAAYWTEIRELVTESYRILAPPKLTALLDEPPRAGQHPD